MDRVDKTINESNDLIIVLRRLKMHGYGLSFLMNNGLKFLSAKKAMRQDLDEREQIDRHDIDLRSSVTIDKDNDLEAKEKAKRTPTTKYFKWKQLEHHSRYEVFYTRLVRRYPKAFATIN